MPKTRILIVDDSTIIRKLMTELLSSEPDFEVVGTAANGNIALSKIPILNPDLITLDIEMPEMDGLSTLTEIRKTHPRLPVIMCSTLTIGGGVSTLDALARGANDYVTKPSGVTSKEEAFRQLGLELIPKIKALAWRGKSSAVNLHPEFSSKTPLKLANDLRTQRKINLVSIGTSTGGPNALTEIIPYFPKNFPVPILIVQHMPPIFTRLLAERLSAKGNIEVKEAEDGDEVTAGKAWIAPGNYHMTAHPNGNKIVIKLNQDPPENSCRPAVDVLFRSVAKLDGAHTLGVVMTGMGQDGFRGSECIREAGGQIFVQDEATSVVWGMPGFVAKSGLADKILPLNQLGQEIVKKVFEKRNGAYS